MTDADLQAQADSIVHAMRYDDAKAFMMRVETHPALLAMYERMIFERFVPNHATASSIDIKTVAKAAANYTLARFDTNHMARSMKEADAIGLIRNAIPVAHLMDISEDEVESMRNTVDTSIARLAKMGHKDSQKVVAHKKTHGSYPLSDDTTMADLALVERIIQATQDILEKEQHAFIVRTHAEELGSSATHDSTTPPANEIATPLQQLGRTTGGDKSLLH